MPENKDNKIEKPPVVVVLGHIDHGKSTLLQSIRSEIRITAKESGGITQHIGAYEVEHSSADSGQVKKITFIDTPGHEAFSAMRMRGASVADIAILVVDANEGVKDQTIEAIKFAKKANIPIIVALNKMDKETAQPQKVLQELKTQGVEAESLGGKVPSVEVSAKEKQGIDELLEIVLLVAEMEGLKTTLEGKPEGAVIESLLDPKQGPLATVILSQGVLKIGDIIGTPSAIGKVKKMSDFQKKAVHKAFPSQPIRILGFEKAPKIGEKFMVFDSLEKASGALGKNREPESSSVLSVQEGEKVMNIILKADVQGTLEAIESALRNIPQDEVLLRIVDAKVGNIDTSDIQMAESSHAYIFGFRVKMDKSAEFFARQKHIKPKIFDVIYELIEAVRKAAEKKLSPKIKKIKTGELKILAIFKQKKDSQIVGGRITAGKVMPDTNVLVYRDENYLGGGKVKSIEEEKKTLGSAKKGQEIGIFVTGAPKINIGDKIVFYREEQEKESL